MPKKRQKASNETIQEWRQGGVLHREDGPAYIITYKDEEQTHITYIWYLFGVIQHEKWYKNGHHVMEAWYKDGKRHRSDGPAIQFFAMPREYWYSDGILYREIWYNADGLPYDEYLWVDGKKVSINQ